MEQIVLGAKDAQFVTLGIGREVFAVPVEAVHEILDMRPIFRMPEAPAYLLGLIELRGRSVPVVDLRLKLGLASTEPTENTRIVVLEVSLSGRHLVLGLVADRVFEVAPIGERGIEPPPDIGVNWRSDYISGIGRRGDSFVIIFDLPRLFSSEDAAFLGAGPTSITQTPEVALEHAAE
jgi:purine-binding chemotaxis protein CheW